MIEIFLYLEFFFKKLLGWGSLFWGGIIFHINSSEGSAFKFKEMTNGEMLEFIYMAILPPIIGLILILSAKKSDIEENFKS